jgi:fructokinase
METASRAGAVIFFEPSAVGDRDLFTRALGIAKLLKFSWERLGKLVDEIELPAEAISIVTDGARGLELRQGAQRHWARSWPAQVVRDTCGSGDMVTVGVIDWLLTLAPAARTCLSVESLMPGVAAGQRLAAENCAYQGARGLFRSRGSGFARAVLNETWAV